jgi:hypothetical protein
VGKTATPDQVGLTKRDELTDLLIRAEEGDTTVLPQLEKVLNDPRTVEVAGDLARHAQRILVDKFSGKNLLFKESLPRKLELMRAELAGPNPTPLERLLAEQIVSCWLHLHHLETVYVSKESMTLELGSYLQRILSATQKRYLAAIKTLAVVRKLAVPVLQVNIAKKQVNVAGTCPTVEPAKG